MRPLLPSAVLLAVLAASTIGATAADPQKVPAAARTSVQLLDAGLTQPNGTVDRATLGQLRLVSLRDGNPWAGMDLVGASLAKQEVASWQATTDDSPESSGDARPTLPSTAGTTADLQLVDYLVRALDGEATSRLSGLQGELGLAPLSLRLDNTGPALSTSVGDASSSDTSLVLGAVELTLGDLLPPGLIDHLPLGVVIDLLGQLPVSVATVDDLLVLVEELVTDLTAAVDADAALDAARAELNELVGDAPGVTDAEAAVAAAEADLGEATASLSAELADRETLRDALADSEATLADALAAAAAEQTELQSALDAAEAAEATAQQAVTDAKATLTAAEQKLSDATATLTTAKAAKTAAQNDVDTITASLKTTNDQIAALEAELLTLDSVLDAARILEIESELDTLKAKKTKLESDLAAAQQKLTDVTTAVTSAEAAVTAAETSVTDAKTSLAAAESELADAQQAVADAEDALAVASPAVASAQEAVDAAQADVAAADQAVAAARAAVATAEDALADATVVLDEIIDQAAEELGAITAELRAEILRLRGEVETLLDQVSEHAVALPDLSELLGDLRAALAGVPVVSLGGVSVDIALDAHATGATAAVQCSLESISVFGQTLADPTCAEASELLATVPEAVAALLAVLPIDDLPLPRIAGLVVSMETSDAPEDGVTWARARVTGLALEVPSVSLAGLSDQLTATLDGLLSDALSAARGLQLASVAPASKGFSPTSVLSTLGDLQSQLDGLPVGSQLDGLRTLGVDLTVGHLAAEALHGATATGPLELGDPYETTAPAPDPVAPGEGEDASGAPTDAPSLPATGGGLGMLSLALMAGALMLRRRGG